MSFIAGLRCIVCCSLNIDSAMGCVLCHDCGQEYPILGGVPVMFQSVSVDKAASVDAAAARQILGAFGLDDDALSVLRMRNLMRQRVRFGNTLIQVESQQFVARVRNTGHAVGGGDQAASGAERDLAAVPRFRWSKTYLPRRMPAGGEISANARLENCGDTTLYASGAGHAKVAMRWKHRGGAPAEAPDLRTQLPIDIGPGQALTIAIRIAPPAQPGRYLLTLRLVQEQVRWLDDDTALTLPVTVETALKDDIPEGWVVLPEPPANYDADHTHGRALLAEWLTAHAPAQPRVLEVGGNAVPMVSLLGLDLGPGLVNVDVDLLGLQVAALRDAKEGASWNTRMRHICADAFDLPFPSGYFDAIVIFASLHHFPDPAALLEHLRRKLRPGGFIGLFCEPVGHIWPGAIDAAFLAELERGVNEQSFSLREYELMFARAELAAVEVLVNKDSLKARLVHAPAGRD